MSQNAYVPQTEAQERLTTQLSIAISQLSFYSVCFSVFFRVYFLPVMVNKDVYIKSLQSLLIRSVYLKSAIIYVNVSKTKADLFIVLR